MEHSRTLRTLNIFCKAVYKHTPHQNRLNPVITCTRRNTSSAISKRLSGKTILITGASSGIGRATALEFARTSPQSLKLVLTARRLDALKELAQEIKKEVGDGVKVLPVKLDVSDGEEIKKFVGGLKERDGGWGDVDVLVNNAYVYLLFSCPSQWGYLSNISSSGLVKGMAKAPDILQDDIAIMFNTNVHGLINMTQAIMPIFLSKSIPSGDIINIGSIAGREGYPGGSIYCASKAAVRTFTEALRKELIATRIRIIEIDPGQVESEFSIVRFGGDVKRAKEVYA
jgi:3-hydroxy acid dehydrogenase/malonic semialdehyde reductase